MAKFMLFGTEGCHLCEEAESLLNETDVKFECRDILSDEAYQERYGIRIPVLRHCASGRELDWPYSLEMLREFITQTND